MYYSPQGYWTGKDAIKKLAEASGASISETTKWLQKQAIWQIYLPSPKYIPRPSFDELKPNAVHQGDTLYLPHDTVGKKTYKYCLTVVDVASRYKEAEPLTDKSAAEVARAFEGIYKRGPLTWPNLLQVDAGKEFMGVAQKMFNKNHVQVRRGIVGNHRSQGIVERFNKYLAERLFKPQYGQEFLLKPGERCTTWVQSLPKVVESINNEVTRLTGLKPNDAIKKSEVPATLPAAPIKSKSDEKVLESDVLVRYLYAAGELEGGTHKRATDPIWSLTIHTISTIAHEDGKPVLYYLDDKAPKRCFVREELQVIPPDTQLPPPA